MQDNIIDVTKKYFPLEILCPPISTAMMLYFHEDSIKRIEKRNEELKKADEKLDKVWKDYWWRSRTNNWLKRHGYPMRRRRTQKKWKQLKRMHKKWKRH